MKKLVFVCAHPDDEAFGPGGTLALYSKTHEVYIICVTRGEAGQKQFINPHEHIARIREKELRNSAHELGVKNVFFLDFLDGELCNNIYHHLASEIQKKLDDIKPEIIMTFEPRGVSGHIDHIVVSNVVSYLFDRLSYLKKAMYFCIPREISQLKKDYFIYFPPGYLNDEVDEIIDVSFVWNKKMGAMKKHVSQQNDFKHLEPILRRFPKEEYFLIKKK